LGITEKLENIIRICRYEDDVDKKSCAVTSDW